MKIDLREIKKLIGMVENAHISEINLEDKDGEKISIKKGGASFEGMQMHPHHMPMNQQSLILPKSESEAVNSDASATTEKPLATNLFEIKSPMVGTFYTSPNPESPVYVKPGDHINAGDTVCIVEAMKLFNEIESEVSGTVEKILLNNSDSVEYGQALFLIKQD